MDDCFEFVINCEEHSEILEECIRFDDYKPWITHSSRIDNVVFPREGFKREFAEGGFKGKLVAFPDYDNFPTFMKWFDKHKDTYGWNYPEIRLLKSGYEITPHVHDKKNPKYTYNMSVNHPEGCRFGVKPKGQIPYQPGDVYRINTYNEHCVLNNSDTDRYHVLLGYERSVSDD